MSCINGTLCFFNSSIKTKGFVNNLNQEKAVQGEDISKANVRFIEKYGERNKINSDAIGEKYWNVIINGFGDSCNCNFETTSSNFLHDQIRSFEYS